MFFLTRMQHHVAWHAAFNYSSYHNVLEVTKDAFEACTTANPISFDKSGSTTVVLTMPGTRYFICGAPGHCQGGMKMEVKIADRPAPATPSSPPPLPPPAGQPIPVTGAEFIAAARHRRGVRSNDLVRSSRPTPAPMTRRHYSSRSLVFA